MLRIEAFCYVHLLVCCSKMRIDVLSVCRYLVQGGRHFSLCQRCSAASKQEAEEVDDEPVKFTTSKAFKSAPSYLNEKADENPTSRTVSIGLSMAGQFSVKTDITIITTYYSEQTLRSIWNSSSNGTYYFSCLLFIKKFLLAKRGL